MALKQHRLGFLSTVFVLFFATGESIIKNEKLWSTAGNLRDSVASPNEIPFQLSLRYNQKHICGAVLIREDFALTTATCVNYGVEDYFSVVAGEHELSFNDETEQVRGLILNANIQIHPNYNKSTHEHDIALLHILPAFHLNEAVQPLALPEVSENFTSTLVTVSGWGYTQEAEGRPSDELRKVSVTVLSPNQCKFFYGDWFHDTMLCAGLESGGRDFCQGDHGGPLFFKPENVSSPAVLVGLPSWNYGCGRPGYPGVYVNVAEYVPWVMDHMS